MGSNPRAELAEASELYESLISALGRQDKTFLNVSIEDLNARILKDVSTQISGVTSEINTIITNGLSSSKEVESAVESLSDSVPRELTAMPATLGLERLVHVPSKVRMLVASFQNAVEDPKSLYPRLACGEIPVDPARITNFAKQYRVLEALNQSDPALSQSDRSMPSPPKTGVDVITNINTSLESLTDTLLESLDNVGALRNSIDELRGFTESLNDFKKPIHEFLSKQEDIRVVLDRITSIFCNDTSKCSDRSLGSENAMTLVSEATSLVDKMKESSHFFDEATARVQSIGGTFSDFCQNMRALLSQSVEILTRLVEILKKFIANLPRIVRELRQFFVPTGLRSLIMHPSQDLLAILKSIDNLSEALPHPDVMENCAKNVVSNGNSARKVDETKKNIDEIANIPARLLAAVEAKDMSDVIVKSVLTSARTIVQEMQDSAVDETIDHVGDLLGVDDLKNKVGEYLPFDREDDSDGKDAGEGGVFTSVVNNVTGSSGFLGKLF